MADVAALGVAFELPPDNLRGIRLRLRPLRTLPSTAPEFFVLHEARTTQQLPYCNAFVNLLDGVADFEFHFLCTASCDHAFN